MGSILVGRGSRRTHRYRAASNIKAPENVAALQSAPSRGLLWVRLGAFIGLAHLYFGVCATYPGESQGSPGASPHQCRARCRS